MFPDDTDGSEKSAVTKDGQNVVGDDASAAPFCFQHRLIELHNKPDELVCKYEQAAHSYGSAKVPLLEHNGRYIVESTNVVEYIYQNVPRQCNHNNPNRYESNDQRATHPCNEDRRQFLRAWDNVVDAYYNILTCCSEKDVEQSAVPSFQQTLSELEDLLPPAEVDSKQNRWACEEEEFGIVECIAAPWVQRFLVTLPYYRNIHLQDVNDMQSSKISSDGEQGQVENSITVAVPPNTAQWMKTVAQHPTVVATECPHDEMLAAAERYYVSWYSPDSAAAVNAKAF